MRGFRKARSTVGRQRLWTFCASASFLVSCNTPDDQLAPPKGDVIVAAGITCIDQQAEDQNAYAEKRVFLEAQSWWGEKNKTTGNIPKYGNAEHLHVAMCFPLHQDVQGSKPFRVRVRAHNLPPGSFIQNTFLHDPTGGELATIVWNKTVTTPDTTFWGSATVNTGIHDNGWREFRILTQVVRPDNAEIHVSSGWCWHVVNTNGKPSLNSGTCASLDTRFNTMGRGWYDCYEYKIGETKNWQYPWTGIGHASDYVLNIGARDGAGDNTTLNHWDVRFDPDFHHGDKGDSIAAGTFGVSNKQVTIKKALLTVDLHHLVIIASASPSCSTPPFTPQDGEVSGVISIPIKVF
jgi:hypothetical protein